MAELKPCPFCGSIATTRSLLGAAERVTCEDCGAIGPIGDSLHYMTRVPYERADAGWNRRVGVPRGRIKFAPDTKHAISEG